MIKATKYKFLLGRENKVSGFIEGKNVNVEKNKIALKEKMCNLLHVFTSLFLC